MTEHVLGAEYADRLVQRARDGMAFAEVPFPRMSFGHASEWLPNTDHGVYMRAELGTGATRGSHWIAWYRETRASEELAHAVADSDHDNDDREAWTRAGEDLHLMRRLVERALNALGSLCPSPLGLRHYPTEWTT